jgi:transposase
MQYIALDAHKRYSLAVVEQVDGSKAVEVRISHQPGELKEFLKGLEIGSPVAVETVGNWYWIVDAIEAAGLKPRLVHARKAKMMICEGNKTDRLDAPGLNRLQKVGTLPTVWIPPSELRDKRDLARSRMVLVDQRTRLKNRLHATLDKYALGVEGVSDVFGKKGRELLRQSIAKLPPETQFAAQQVLSALEGLEEQIHKLEKRIREVFEETEKVRLLKTLPGIGFTLAVVIAGEVERFSRPEKMASYSGTTPRVFSSGGKTRYGYLRADVNQYLKWAFIEAANCVCLHQKSYPRRHVSRLYQRIKNRKEHGKAIGAVARHLAEAAYWVLKKKEPYREPAGSTAVLPTERSTRVTHGLLKPGL